MNPASPILRAAIIGCGINGIGRGSRDGADLWFTHAGAYHRHARVNLVAAADVDAGRRDLCGRTWNVTRLYSSADELLRAEPLDIVSVCTPDDGHAAVALVAIAAGVPVVFCEKPISGAVADAERMVDAARRRGAVLAVNHHRRWEAGHREVRAAIGRGDLGVMLSVRMMFSGDLRRVGTHAVDLLRYFFGEVEAILGVVATGRDGRQIRVRFAGGVEATIDAWPKQGAAAFDLFELDLVGSRARVLIADFGARIQHWTVEPSPEYGGDLELSRTPSVMASDMPGAFLNGVDAMVTARTTGGETASSGAEALATLRVLDAIDAASRSAATQSAPVPR